MSLNWFNRPRIHNFKSYNKQVKEYSVSTYRLFVLCLVIEQYSYAGITKEKGPLEYKQVLYICTYMQC